MLSQLPKDKFTQESWENAGTKEKSQARQNDNRLSIKQSQGPLAPPLGLEIISWALSFELFCRYWKVEVLYVAHKHVDPRSVGTRKLMLTVNYLTTNQSEECPRTDHTPQNPLPSPCLWKPFLNSCWGVLVFWASAALDFLLGALP